MQQLLIIAAIVAVLLFGRWVMRQPPRARRKWLLYGAGAVLVVLAATGRLHWLAAVIGAAVPMMYKLMALARFAPLFVRVFHNVKFGSQRNSRFQSRSLRLEINPLTGTIDGEVLAGHFKGRRLSGLSEVEIRELLEEFERDDPQAAQLLQSYIVIRSRRAHDGGPTGSKQAARGTMTKDEARRILGVGENASREDIIEAHRRLIQRLHPDRGGSAHLAAMINQAKACLLE